MANPVMNTKMLKRYILDSVNDAQLLIPKRELNEFSDNAKSILIFGKGNYWLQEIISQFKTLFDEIDPTNVHKVLCCIFYNQNSSNELHINDLNTICQFFNQFTELIPIVGLYKNNKLRDTFELIVLIE